MPTLLSLPVEIRTMILQYAVAREVHVCHRECTSQTSEDHHKAQLRGPNLNLMLVCRQFYQEITSLKLHYRITVAYWTCARVIYHSLRKGTLEGNKIACSQIFFKPKSKEEEERFARLVRTWKSVIQTSKHRWRKHGIYKSIDAEESVKCWHGWEMMDLVFRF
jgi:hypothetical protein